jgi:uracil phosphoribosyltransferase
MDQHLTIVDHPLVQHKLTLMRDTATSTAMFRQLLCEISQLLAYEVTRNLPMSTRQIETPLITMDAPVIDRNGSQLNMILAGPFSDVAQLRDALDHARDAGFADAYVK